MKNLSEEGHTTADNKTPVSVTPRDSDENRKNPEKRRSSDIAIIGLSGRFAGSPNLEAFWSHLQKGQSCIMPIRREGWEQHSNLDPTCVPPSQEFRGGMLEHIDRFDPFFFNISPLEATRMDPQQRLFLEEAYKAFEDAGYSAEQLSNKKVGVFVGARASDYQEQALRRDSAGILSGASRLSGIDAHLFLGNDMAILAARVSYFLNCKGPSLTIDTTSSSSLVAVHLACENIRTGESEMALAGGVFVLSSPYFYLMTAKTNALSPDGVCRTFDNAANGIVLGEGVGAIVLKPLERALADGDHIHGVILGSAINQDGKTFGITAPSQLSQKALLTDLYKKAAIHPETVSYIEAHGTGTKLGDPIEMKALTEAFRDFTDKRQFCAVGSLKPNIGHTIMSAGIAGLLKILLAMKYQQIPPTIHLEQVNQQIDVESSPFFINTELKEWQRCDASPRRAGISSFGFSGTNCHVILEEPPLQKPRTQKQTRPYAFFPFSAKTKAALMQKVEDMVKWLETEGETYSVEDISYTLVQGRSHFSMRSAVVARDRSDLLHALRAIQSQDGSGHDIEQEKDKSKRPESVLHTSGHELLQELRDNGSLAQEDYREKLLRLAGLYMQGECLDWGQLFAKGRKFRVPLPTYPFRGESYWIETTEEESRPLMENLSQRLRKSHQQVQKVPLDTERGVQEKEKLHEALSRVVSDLLRVRVEEIDPQTPLSEYGFDSITFTEFANRLNMTYDLHVTPPLFYEHSTISRLAQYVQATSSSALATHLAEASPQAGTQRDLTPRPVTTDEVPSTMNNPMVTTISIHDACAAHALMPEKQAYTATSPVAIIGMSGVFPQAPDVESLWSNLLAGRDCIGEIPPSRWDWQTCFRNRTTKEHSTNVKWAGIVENVELFDPQFFGISPREAEQMDPQQRLLMTYVWKAIEDAGYDASSLSGSNTALFVGMINSGYSERLSQAGKAIESYSSTCQVPSVGPGRMSYFLNLHGPSEVIEAACSSSLVAIHRGVNAIESGECHIAIVGGVNTLISPELHISFSKAGMLSPDGCCKAFSASANGYVRSEGVGMLVLKKLSDAEQASDHIYGVIRGSAENHGGRATSLTAPNPRAQADVLITAYRKAGIDPRTVGYIEAHGTGTVLGDPIEINGLKTAFSELRTGARPCPSDNQEEPIPQAWCGVGSVKSNIGHLEWAAGVAGVIKVLLQLQHKKLVKSLHCEQINPYIELKGSPFYVVQENREWEALRDHAGNILPRRAGVSSFGFGGVNAHVVLEEYVPRPQASRQVSSMEPGAIIVLSAKNEERLNAQVQQLLAWVQTITSPDEPLGPAQELSRTPSLQDLAYTLQVGRSSMEERLAMQVSSFADLVEKLQRFLQEPQKAGDWYRGQTKQHKETVDLFEDDEELQEAIDKWLKRGKYKKLLQGWVKGLSIDWKLLYTGGTGSERGPGSARDTIPTAVPALPHRISLPTYPFAQERYWIPTVQGIQATDETADLPRPSISLSGLAQPPSQSRSNAVVVPELAPMLPEASSASAQGTIAATNVQMASLVDSGRFKEARTPVAQGLQSTTVPL